MPLVVDYNASSIPQTVTFAPGVSKQCFDVEILDDNIVEGSEMFTISVVLQGSLETPTDAHITIEDDDGKFYFTYIHFLVCNFTSCSSTLLPQN